MLKERGFISAWGHANTALSASRLIGSDLTPATARPALVLTSDNLPALDGQSFTEVWLLSPDYTPGFRPAIGQEVTAESIQGWKVLQIQWTLLENPQP